jgi:hypothetical protein
MKVGKGSRKRAQITGNNSIRVLHNFTKKCRMIWERRENKTNKSKNKTI